MNKLKAFATVFSYPTPEVLSVIGQLVGSYPAHVIDEGWVRSEMIDYQDRIFDDLVGLRKGDVLGLQGFEHRYPTYGSDHAICEYLTYLGVKEGVTDIYILEDDYEGFAERALSRGIRPRTVVLGTNPRRLDPGVWFISNPSARDGNVLPDGMINDILEAGHRIVYDLAYLGTTDDRTFNLQHENIDAAFVSFSKPYGLFSHRIGFSFFRHPVPSLEANALWFKNIFGLTLAWKVIAGLSHREYAARYKALQRALVKTIVDEMGLPLRPSDAFLLAHVTEKDARELTDAQREVLQPYSRGCRYRLCLTPYFVALRDAEVMQ